jgi:hypothetical protein
MKYCARDMTYPASRIAYVSDEVAYLVLTCTIEHIL